MPEDQEPDYIVSLTCQDGEWIAELGPYRALGMTQHKAVKKLFQFKNRVERHKAKLHPE